MYKMPENTILVKVLCTVYTIADDITLAKYIAFSIEVSDIFSVFYWYLMKNITKYNMKNITRLILNIYYC